MIREYSISLNNNKLFPASVKLLNLSLKAWNSCTIYRIPQNCNPDINGQNKFDIYIASILFFIKKYSRSLNFYILTIWSIWLFDTSSVKIITFPSVWYLWLKRCSIVLGYSPIRPRTFHRCKSELANIAVTDGARIRQSSCKPIFFEHIQHECISYCVCRES